MEVYEVVAVLVSFLIGLIASRQYYKKFKAVLNQITTCLDEIHEALEDDQLTKEEVKEIYESCIKPIRWDSGSNK